MVRQSVINQSEVVDNNPVFCRDCYSQGLDGRDTWIPMPEKDKQYSRAWICRQCGRLTFTDKGVSHV